MRALARCLTEAESYLATQAISRLAGPGTHAAQQAAKRSPQALDA